MKLFNTLTRQKEEYTSDTAKMYVCGITPYDVTHLGHAFTYTFFDVLARYLRHLGKPVTYIQNITDIDDDILRKARQTGEDWQQLGERNWQLFSKDNACLNNEKPTKSPHASRHISQIDAINVQLVKKGLAYQRQGNVYYDSSKWASLGKLSRFPSEKLLSIANERGNDPDDPAKKNPLDFLLWQAARPTEPSWPSSFGPGRPGWHIECSAMALAYLGPTLDIHGGGADLMFPHHEAEIAQSESYTGVPFAKFWLHVAMLRYQGEKMSKSLGNMVFVSDLFKQHSPNAVRLLLLAHHYRQEWEYTAKEMEMAQAMERALLSFKDDGVSVEYHRKRFFEALDDDMDTPRAIEELLALAQGSKKDKVKHALQECAQILGLVI